MREKCHFKYIRASRERAPYNRPRTFKQFKCKWFLPGGDKLTTVDQIRGSGLSIYDQLLGKHNSLFLASNELESVLSSSLSGLSLNGLPLRTRSKVVKEHICDALGYPRPKSFRKTQPRFPGQNFDTYIQKSRNLQIWNEEISPSRRYVIIQLDDCDQISAVRVISGDSLAKLDTTGTLTQKYQARVIIDDRKTELVSRNDTDNLSTLVGDDCALGESSCPSRDPSFQEIIPILQLYEKLKALVGISFSDAGRDQERNRGGELHRLICKTLGYSAYKDNGQFPDIRHQLLEVKLQTSPTIDLGLVCPDSDEPLDLKPIKGCTIRHCDVRYAVFYGSTDGNQVILTHFFISTGERFFSRFPRFGGKVLNKKLQIPLPNNFFS